MTRVQPRTRVVLGGVALALLIASIVAGVWLAAGAMLLVLIGQVYELRAARRRQGR